MIHPAIYRELEQLQQDLSELSITMDVVKRLSQQRQANLMQHASDECERIAARLQLIERALKKKYG